MSKSEIFEDDVTEITHKPLLPPASQEDVSNFKAAPASFLQLFKGTHPMTKVYLLIGVLSTTASSAIYSLLFLLMGQLYEGGTEEDEDDYDIYHETCKLIFCWTALSFVMLFFSYSSSYCFTRISQEVGQLYRSRYFRAILDKDISYFDTHNAAELPAKMSYDCEAIEAGTGDRLMLFIDVVTYTFFGTAMVFEKNPQLALVGLAVAPIELFVSGLLTYGLITGGKKKQQAYAKAGAIAEEALSEVRTVASLNAQAYISEQYTKELGESQRATSKMGLIQGLGTGILWMVWMLIGALIFSVAAKWISDERKNWLWGDVIDGADAITVFWIVSVVSRRLGSMAPGLAACIEAKAAGGRALQFINEPTKVVNGPQKRALEGQIELKNIHFSYPSRPDQPILKGLSFVCEKGQKTAIVGESGVGKSTIIQLMERFYEPSEGIVAYDGVPLGKFDITSLRKQVGYISQEPVLFNLTIEDNISLGNSLALFPEVEAAAKEANAFDFIIALQDGFLTYVGPRGSKLSGGQKQRIAIARAMVKKPKILLLDEATSALDNESEEIVLRALNAIHERRRITMVSVTQKLSTIRNSDKIIVLRDGKIEEEGNHETLMVNEGLYSAMSAAQSSDSGAQTKQNTQASSDKGAEASMKQTQIFDKMDDKSSVSEDCSMRRIRTLIFKHWPLLLVATISACVSAATTPLFGYTIAKLTVYISGSAKETMVDDVEKFCEILIALSGVSFFAFTVLNWSISAISARMTFSFRQATFFKMLHLDVGYFSSNPSTTSMLSSNLVNDADKISNASLLSTYVSIFVSFSFGVSISIYAQWRLGLVMVALIPIESFLCARGYFMRQQLTTYPKHREISLCAVESILDVKTIVADNMQAAIEEKYSNSLQQAYESTRAEGHLTSFAYGFSTAAVFWGLALSFWYGAYLQKQNQAREEDVNIVIFTTLMTVLGIVTASTFIPDLQEGSNAAVRLFRMADYKPKIDSASGDGIKENIQGRIEFAGVGFQYQQKDNLVLRDISFEVPVGKRIGITGTSGSGKTTITQLLLRFFDPTEGHISIDGVDIRKFNIKHLRENIAMVGQEPVLFSGTVRSNVDFGLGKSDEDIKQALTNASIPRFADDLDRDVGVRGNLVSGGQKQRIAIARAILRSPKILILDEATSALDSKTERKILTALEFAGQGKTMLVIAHRLSTIEKCDEILVMDAGEIKERGSHNELKLCEGSIYRGLLAANT